MISNSGYEAAASAATPGTAANWTATTTGSLETTAEFAGDTALTLSGYETFDHGWGDDDPELLLSDLVDVLVEKHEIERFERLWPQTIHSDPAAQGFFFLTALESSVFDSAAQAFEDFENGWGSPIDLDIVLSTPELAHAGFDGDDQEDFEDSWGFAAFTLVSVASASFDAGGMSTSTGSPGAAEKFTFKARQQVQSDVGGGTLGAVSPPLLLIAGDAVTLVAESGALPVPLLADTTYIVDSVVSNAAALAPFTGATPLALTADGTGANYVIADPGRFWLDEL